ncbi:MAG TPA: hypothetical protein VNZ03_25230 [Terriglobales bacterium]|jgi:hypothetical protein|nr:hypothetical protein [Terriglobales bacterium]
MTIALILVVVASLALGFLIRLTKGRALPLERLENPTEHIRAVDIEAFRNLVDPDEEEFLRTHLPPAEFRKIQRERLRAAVDYVSCAAQNAAILLRLADAGRHSSDPATAEAAEKLVDNAIRLRLYASFAIPRLYLGMILPGARISPVHVAERYEQMTRLVVLLGCLQYPTRGVSAAL